MKKLIATLLAIVMLAALSVGAMAANNFTQSPSKQGAPEVTSVVVTGVDANSEFMTALSKDPGTPGCIELKATAYGDIDQQLNNALEGGEDAKNILEAAVQSIKTVSSVQSLVPAASLPAGSMVNGVFDISLIKTDEQGTGTQSIENLPVGAKITIKLTLSNPNFVALLHYKETTPGQHQWEKVEGATLVNGTLSFQVDSLSPFAIVVKDTSSGPSSPATGASAPIACAVGAVVFGVAGAALLKKGKEN